MISVVCLLGRTVRRRLMAQDTRSSGPSAVGQAQAQEERKKEKQQHKQSSEQNRLTFQHSLKEWGGPLVELCTAAQLLLFAILKVPLLLALYLLGSRDDDDLTWISSAVTRDRGPPLPPVGILLSLSLFAVQPMAEGWTWQIVASHWPSDPMLSIREKNKRKKKEKKTLWSFFLLGEVTSQSTARLTTTTPSRSFLYFSFSQFCLEIPQTIAHVFLHHRLLRSFHKRINN